MNQLIAFTFILAGLTLNPLSASPAPQTFQSDFYRLKKNYAAIAYASYKDAETGARVLLERLRDFVREPSAKTFENAKQAWIQAREAYSPTEVFRFSDGPIESVEGRINAWPLDEAYLDYVQDQDGNRLYSGLINKPSIFPTRESGEAWTNLKLAFYTQEADRFEPAAKRDSFQKLIASYKPHEAEALSETRLLRQLLIESNEFGGEENVSLGFHAIEFLLWGQDLYANQAGQRPWTDYLPEDHKKKTAINGLRRQKILLAITEQLVADLSYVRSEWEPTSGAYYRLFMSKTRNEALTAMTNGMTQLLGFELAGERMFVAYDASSQEDEHSCFSDNTHRDILQNLQGARNIMTGSFAAVFSDEKIDGSGYLDWIRSLQPGLAIQMNDKISSIEQLIEGSFSPNQEKLRFDQIITAETLFEEPSLVDIQNFLARNPLWRGNPEMTRAVSKARLYLSVRELYDQADLMTMSLNKLKEDKAWKTEVKL